MTHAFPTRRASELQRELIKVASLEDDLVVAHMEETAPTQASWITPFKNGPFSVLEDVLDYAGHGCPPELNLEHLSDGITTIQRLHHQLEINGVRSDKRRVGKECFGTCR